MKNSKISEAYSSALINIAIKNDTLVDDLPNVHLFYEVLTKEYIHSIANNGTQEEKKEWLAEVFESWMPYYWMILMKLLVDKNEISIIADIAIDFLEKGYEKINVSFGKLYSAKEITKEQFNAITHELQKNLKRSVILAQEIDKSLIAGLKIEVENQIYDNSLYGQAKKIRDNALKIMEGN